MESSLYKDFTTSRGLVYHYYAVQAQGDKPTLLFCHGFPSTSWDWRHIAPYFKQRGYGVIVPDLLGYGGTSKPTDPATYRHSLICKDVVEILDAEGIRRAVAIGHDWYVPCARWRIILISHLSFRGSRIVSRLANYFPDRFIAYAFFAVPFNPPHAFSNVNQILAFTKQQFGYELIGYWLFFSEEGAESIIRAHVSTTNLCFKLRSYLFGSGIPSWAFFTLTILQFGEPIWHQLGRWKLHSCPISRPPCQVI